MLVDHSAQVHQYTFTVATKQEVARDIWRMEIAAPELAAALEKTKKENGLDFAALMVTDPVRGNSELLFKGDEAVRRALPYRRAESGVLLMPGVLSRKKQLLPEVLAALA